MPTFFFEENDLYGVNNFVLFMIIPVKGTTPVILKVGAEY